MSRELCTSKISIHTRESFLCRYFTHLRIFMLSQTKWSILVLFTLLYENLLLILPSSHFLSSIQKLGIWSNVNELDMWCCLLIFSHCFDLIKFMFAIHHKRLCVLKSLFVNCATDMEHYTLLLCIWVVGKEHLWEMNEQQNRKKK